ncbi:L-seryl-tRNA(Sec) kinase [Ochlerotatus camptorhynchus]|uniref:L-seryl-tRNA(Sec) kinase n=1 Tax=Ochlerotatus camptorhynchus TaxID=644619 RepID=UPI0031CF8DB8
MNKICLHVLIGIPGAGKTTFCEGFQAYLLEKRSPARLIHVCFDRLIKIEDTFDLENGCFKEKRRQLLESLGKIIEGIKFNDQTCVDQVNEELTKIFNANISIDLDSTASGNIYAIFLDDNMYYRSMRYEAFSLARKHGMGYLQSLFDVPLAEAKARNASRPNPIPEEIISRMWIKLEQPSWRFYKWERNTLELLGNSLEFEQLEQAILNCANNPESPLETKAEKQPVEQSVVHKVDLLLRKAVGDIMKNRKEIFNGKELKLLSDQLSVRRKTILDDLRAGLIEIDPECATNEQIQLLM